MTISKEERAELRDFIHEVSKGSPGFPRWEYDGSNPFEHPAIVAHTVPDGAQDIGNLPSKWDTQFACAAVNAAPKLLAALDASDERIAELEDAEEQRTVEEKRHEAQFYVCEECGERKHNSNGGTDDEACDQCVEIRLLNARIAELEAGLWPLEACDVYKGEDE